MSFFKRFVPSIDKNFQQELEERSFEQSECPIDCGTCHFKYPSSIKVDESSKLWNSSSPYDIHILIPTNKSNWEHNALDDASLPFVQTFNKWVDHNASRISGLPKHNVKVNVCSLSSPGLENDPAYTDGTKGDLLVLPQFVWIRNVDTSDLDAVLPILSNLAEATTKSELHLGQTGGLEVSVDPNQSWIFLCSHRTRDKRCGVTAPIIKKEIDTYTRDLGFYRDFGDERPGGIQVAYVNHVGGHKYVANVLIYLKSSGKMVWLARIGPTNVKPIIDECVLGVGR
ncbi:hypothetical protein PSN45_004883 [Yamadazyma tenuis]|uniref:uncharacterized protein n=1 Tax=Candida tenuis TaxID=2315449 RepID=UPI0027AB2C32|nr:hypothetical protein PSN45_004883 [Yamadazyma tenuis]